MEEGKKGQVRPFDIVDYQETLAEATVTVREVQTVLMSIERLLSADSAEGHMESILESANRFEDEVVDEILTRAFLYGVALMLLFFAVLLGYRVLATRLSVNPNTTGEPAK
jgi:ABC-type transport system involved in cytochrome c biogenesis permease component